MLVALMGLLSACATTHHLDELRQMTPRGTPYAIALTQKYLEFSEEEAKSYDWTDSSYFAEKGLMAGYGQTVTPEEIMVWDVPEDMKPELLAAREKLVELLSEEMRFNHPEKSAEAVFAFDCWLEELEESRYSPEMRLCQVAYYDAINALEFTQIEEETVEESASEEVENKERIATTAYLVYFGHNDTQFAAASKQVVQQVADEIKKSPVEEILIHGHTDRSGSTQYNLNLSEKRALSVLEALLELGVPRNILKYFAFGETDPAVPTEEGVKEPKNRRVEIFLG